MESFVPKGQEELLLPNPIRQNYTPPAYLPKSLLYSRNVRESLSHTEEADILEEGSIPKRLGLFTRHNPHPGRVRHIRGLFDGPICMVEDNYERRLMFSPPSGEDFSINYRPKGSTRYSANHKKQIPAVGIVPVTYAWRDELERKTNKALNKALGQFSIPHSQQSQRNNQSGEFDHLQDEQIVDLLCRILQTESIPACHAWLQSCNESEKSTVLNMLRMAATGEIDPYPQQLKQSSQKPKTHKSTTTSAVAEELMNNSPADPPFKLPKHDTIIPRMASRQIHQRSFHQRLQMELDNQADILTTRVGSSTRPRSRSLTTPQEMRYRPSSSRSTSRPRPFSATGVYRTIRNDVTPLLLKRNF